MAVKGTPAAKKALTKKAAMKVPAKQAAMKKMPAEKAAMKKMPAKKAGMKNHAMKSVKMSRSPWNQMTEKKMRASEKEPAQKRRFVYSVSRMSAQEKKRVWNEDMDECVGEWVEVVSYNKSFREPPPCPRKKWIQACMEERGWLLLKVKLAHRPSGWLKIESHELPHL
jgi:hypothetical protein